MTTTVTNPVVVVLFGAMAHPSLAAQIVASVDLVAGQPGPWELSDDERAQRAADLVARLAPPLDLFGLLVDARRKLGEVWEAHRATMPGYLLHDVEQLEARLGGFIDSYRDTLTGILTPAEDAPPADAEPSGPPPLTTAIGWRRDEWIRFLQQAGVSPASAMAALRVHAEANDLHPPARLRDVVGVEAYVAFLLDHVATATGADR